ncbi:precorrin-6y C5,15-methyltransferase (decarboxylating) subunit CbiE [Caldalkalibacillus salinus]|uniref:precorrin-6y C5,15-methyltransferase (decarboxylating) subunit CbiE n=1 Tax=Caldalkalibacillus salinus TaxID=2803787 RepID=UPI00192435CB
MEPNIKVIGMGDDGRQSLLPLYEKWVMESDVLFGGERLLANFNEYTGEKRVIKGGLTTLVEQLNHLKQQQKDVVVLASGDPLFYGIGGYLAKKVNATIYPYISAIQLAFARIQESWQDAYVTSVHGRSMRGLAQRIDGRPKVAILTDQENTPASIAQYLLSFGMHEYRAFVAENLGGEHERCEWYDLETLAETTCSPLNTLILKQTEKSPTWTIGIEDDAFAQRKPEKGLITKREIRTLSLSALKLEQDSIVWDIGTCTGSVAIEAARCAPDGAVYAIEKNEQDLENCRRNMARFRTDITLVHGKAPAHLDQWPEPDAIFIGGTAGGMNAILDICCQRLKSEGRVVLNAVTIENLYQALEAFQARGFHAEVTLAQVSRSKPILNLTRFESLNPIYIITAYRQKGAS